MAWLSVRIAESDDDAALVAMGSVLAIALAGCALMKRPVGLLGARGVAGQLGTALPIALSVGSAAYFVTHDAHDAPAGLPLAAQLLAGSLGRMAGNAVRDGGNQLLEKAPPQMVLARSELPILLEPRIRPLRLATTCLAYFNLIIANRQWLTPALGELLGVDPRDESLAGHFRREAAAAAGIVALEAVHALSARLWTGLAAFDKGLRIDYQAGEGASAVRRNALDPAATWARVVEHTGMRTLLGSAAEALGNLARTVDPGSRAGFALEVLRCALLVLIDLRADLVEHGRWLESRGVEATNGLELRPLVLPSRHAASRTEASLPDSVASNVSSSARTAELPV